MIMMMMRSMLVMMIIMMIMMTNTTKGTGHLSSKLMFLAVQDSSIGDLVTD